MAGRGGFASRTERTRIKIGSMSEESRLFIIYWPLRSCMVTSGGAAMLLVGCDKLCTVD